MDRLSVSLYTRIIHYKLLRNALGFLWPTLYLNYLSVGK